MTARRRTAAEIIGIHFCTDMADVSEGRYQPSRYSSPSIYTFGNDYYAAPSNNLPPKNMTGDWHVIGEHHGRKVFCLKAARQ
jgi:hypothetical protein